MRGGGGGGGGMGASGTFSIDINFMLFQSFAFLPFFNVSQMLLLLQFPPSRPHRLEHVARILRTNLDSPVNAKP